MKNDVRDKAITLKVLNGMTYKQVALEEKVSIERARQITFRICEKYARKFIIEKAKERGISHEFWQRTSSIPHGACNTEFYRLYGKEISRLITMPK